MTQQEKEILFSSFLVKWNNQFNKIPFILKYISTYQNISVKLNDFQSLSIDKLKSSQLEWVSLIAQFDNSIEISFFKDYWVPIQENGYDYFIDLSSESLPLFEAQYFAFEPYRWYKKYIFKDLAQFLIFLDNPKFSIEEHFEQLEVDRLLELDHILDERDELGFAGKLELFPITKDKIFIEEKNSDFKFQENCITFNEVSPIIVGLLPHDCSITLESFSASFNRIKNVCEKVKSIEALVYLLQTICLLFIDSYSITFNSTKECRATFKDNTFKIIHTDSNFLNDLIEKYEAYKKS